MSDSADICKAFTEFGGFLLMLYPKRMTLAQWDAGGGSLCIALRPVGSPGVQRQQLNKAGTGRGHSELLSWLLISSPMLCTVVFCCENPSVLPFGSLMLADGNPAQLSKTLNNLLRTKLLGLRAGSFSLSFSFSLCKLPFRGKVSNYRSGRQV